MHFHFGHVFILLMLAEVFTLIVMFLRDKDKTGEDAQSAAFLTVFVFIAFALTDVIFGIVWFVKTI